MKIIHTAITPVSAKNFIEPLVIHDNQKFDSVIWLDENKPNCTIQVSIIAPKQHIGINLEANIFSCIKKYSKLLSLIKKEKPKLIICHFSRGSLLPLLASWILRVPNRLYFNHGVPYLGYKGFMRFALKTLEKCNIKLATNVVSVNSQLAKELSSLTKKQVTVLKPGSVCGIDSSYFMEKYVSEKHLLRKQFNISNTTLIFLYVGRPVIRKGFLVAYHAFLELKKTYPDARAKLIMAGISTDDLKKHSSYPLPHDVSALGHISNMEELYELANVVILPSYHEGLPYCLLEGAAKKCALFASKLPGMDSIMIENKNGFYIHPNNTTELAKLMLFAINNPNTIDEMGRFSQRHVKIFSREAILKEYSKLIHSIIC